MLFCENGRMFYDFAPLIACGFTMRKGGSWKSWKAESHAEWMLCDIWEKAAQDQSRMRITAR